MNQKTLYIAVVAVLAVVVVMNGIAYNCFVNGETGEIVVSDSF